MKKKKKNSYGPQTLATQWAQIQNGFGTNHLKLSTVANFPATSLLLTKRKPPL